jgi:pimeloyl-ACP methyl ester carboxylesterase
MKHSCLLLLSAACACAASLDGVPVHYTAAGKGSNTVVLVHGWTCDESSWSEQAPALAKTYRVVTIDLPGHGKTPLPKDGKLSMDVFAHAIEAVRTELKAERLVLAGHSMGTPVVVQYARLYPEHTASLVFVDGLVNMTIPPGSTPKADMWTGEQGRKNRENMVRGMFKPATSPATQAKIRNMMLGTPEATAAAAMLAMYDPAIWKGDVISLPILGLYAEKSPVGNQAYMKEHFPHMEYNEIAGTGHFLMLEKPDEFNRLLLDFLARQKFN